MANVAFNLVDYAKQNSMKLIASAKLKNGSSAKFFANDNRLDCFVLDANKKIVGAKGAQGSKSHLLETFQSIYENLSSKIESISTYVK